MPTNTWRGVERWYATRLGGQRVHSGDKRDERDVRSKYLSVEVKHRIEAVPKTVRKYLTQAKKNAKRGTLPFVIAHTPRTRMDDAVVYISFKDFEYLLAKAGFAPGQKEEIDGEVQQDAAS